MHTFGLKKDENRIEPHCVQSEVFTKREPSSLSLEAQNASFVLAEPLKSHVPNNSSRIELAQKGGPLMLVYYGNEYEE